MMNEKEKEKILMFQMIQASKDLEQQLLKDGEREAANQVALYTDSFYPGNAVKEIWRAQETEIFGERPPIPQRLPEYYYRCREELTDKKEIPLKTANHVFYGVERKHLEWLSQGLKSIGFYLPDFTKYGDVKFRYCDLGGQNLYFADMELTGAEQMKMIYQLNNWYSATDQEVEEFVEEFYWFVIGIMDGMILLNPKYLLLEEVLEQFLLLLPETIRGCYKETFENLKSGCRPVPCME